MAEYLHVLEQAISDTGYWRWWVARLPKFLQVEFGGTQIWNPPEQEGKPPSGMIALRFTDLISVSFAIFRDAPDDFPQNWPELVHDDVMKPLSIIYDRFGFNDPQLAHELLADGKYVDTRLGGSAGTVDFSSAGVTLAFRAGPAGLVVAAHELILLNHQGVIKPEEIEEKYTQWWEYWNTYWQLRDSASPLPRDYACEVTIPAGE